MIKIVVIDPSAPYASGIRDALLDAKIAVDKLLNGIMRVLRLRLWSATKLTSAECGYRYFAANRALLAVLPHAWPRPDPRRWTQLRGPLQPPSCPPDPVGRARLRATSAPHPVAGSPPAR